MRAMGLPPHILVEEKIAIEAEYYLAWRIDDVRQAPVLLFSTARRQSRSRRMPTTCTNSSGTRCSRSIPQHLVRFLLDAGAARRPVGAIARFAAELYRLFVAEDAELIEINPLGVTANGQIVALDAKVVLDDSARFRHREWARMAVGPASNGRPHHAARARAAEHGLTLVELDGCVALFAGGAGFGMSLVDHPGRCRPAGRELRRCVRRQQRGGLRRHGRRHHARARPARREGDRVLPGHGRDVAEDRQSTACLTAWDRAPVKKPLVVGFAVGAISEREMTAAEACALCGARGHHVIAELDELIPTLRRIVGSANSE